MQSGSLLGVPVHKLKLNPNCSARLWSVYQALSPLHGLTHFFQQPKVNKQSKPTKTPQKMASVGEDVEKREHLCTVGGNVTWCSRCGKQYGGSSKS